METKKYTKDEIESSIKWINMKILQLETEIDSFNKGKNPIMENSYKKQIDSFMKLKKEFLNIYKNEKNKKRTKSI